MRTRILVLAATAALAAAAAEAVGADWPESLQAARGLAEPDEAHRAMAARLADGARAALFVGQPLEITGTPGAITCQVIPGRLKNFPLPLHMAALGTAPARVRLDGLGVVRSAPGEPPALHEVGIEVAVSIGVEKSNARSHFFGNVELSGFGGFVRED